MATFGEDTVQVAQEVPEHLQLQLATNAKVSPQNTVKSAIPDPLIAPDHQIHWYICQMMYVEYPVGLPGGWAFVGRNEDSGLWYNTKTERCILCFRGTVLTSAKDILNDLQIMFTADNCSMGKVEPAIEMIKAWFKSTNSKYPLQVTGHSLGGAIARCVGRALNLNAVTFNAAAPPNGIVATRPPPEETNYHIITDLISAWQAPNVKRIDRGYRPTTVGLWANVAGVISPALQEAVTWTAFIASLATVAKAHSLNSFAIDGGANPRIGKISDAVLENEIFKQWWDGFPESGKKILAVTLGIAQRNPVAGGLAYKDGFPVIP
jgi:hypothetical protein